MKQISRDKKLGAVTRVLLVVLAVLSTVGIAGGIWLWQQLRASLPQLDGQVGLAGLAAPVKIDRDDLGVPTIHAANRLDAARATGFLHAQERYFQMDLLRRAAAGELAELLGDAALSVDRSIRIHRFRWRAHAAFAALPKQDQELARAYTAGVNAGLSALAAAPFEYLLLRQTPAPWLPEDILLVIYAMYADLQGREFARESTYGVMHDILPATLYAFLAPQGTEWDAPLQGGPLPSPPLPPPDVFDLRRQAQGEIASRQPKLGDVEPDIGSNSWAVVGSRTAHGSALLANDMHLGLTVPNTWYRVSLVYPDGKGVKRRITGVTLPGAPAIVAGSNGRVAWGLTNAYGDWSDLVVLEPVPGDPDAYLTPEGPRRFEHIRETIRIKQGGTENLDLLYTQWGPVFDQDYRERRRALRWVAHDPEAVNLEIVRLETADTVTEAIAVANRTGVPAQNFMVADADGHIGWSILGPIPRRFGFDGRVPESWADGTRGWDGWLAPAEYPRIIDPPAGRLWTANARVVEGVWLARLGGSGYALGARAQQIRDALLAQDKVSEADMLALQLDDRALFLQRWRDLLLRLLTPEALAADPRRRELRNHVENWQGRAAVDSVGYRLVRDFRLVLAKQVLAPLTVTCAEADARFNYDLVRQMEGPLWRLLTEQPRHLLNPRYPNWQAQMLAAIDTLVDQSMRDGPLSQHTWGAFNTSQIRHPLSRFIPGGRFWLDMPALPLPGDVYMPRVQTPNTGASQRLVVSPGHEDKGVFEMPDGQSGHPLSPHYRDSHAAWTSGKASPFLPGPTVNTLMLLPQGGKP